MTRRRRERTEKQQVEQEDEAVVGCLDVLRGASALLARHKAEVAGLLLRRGGKDLESLERLASDLTEVLSTATTSSGSSSSRHQGREQEQEGMAAAAEVAGPRRGGGGSGMAAGGGAKRVKAQQAVQAGGRRQGLSASSSAAAAACEGRDALSIPEVLEHVMSFATVKELLLRLSRVCRLWRRVSEGEGPSLRVLERNMPCALLGGKESLHAKLGGSARRCLLVLNEAEASGRLMCAYQQLGWCEKLVFLGEVYRDHKCLVRWRGKLNSWIMVGGRGMRVGMEAPISHEAKAFSPGSFDVDTVQEIFVGDRLGASFFVMDEITGVTACVFRAWFNHRDEPPEPEAGTALLRYNVGPEPVTSMTYAGPPLQAELQFELRPSEPFEEDEINTLHEQRDRSWTFGADVRLALTGQSCIYGERFVRTRLAEEAMAAKQHGSR